MRELGGTTASFFILPPSLIKGRGSGVHPEGFTLKGIGFHISKNATKDC